MIYLVCGCKISEFPVNLNHPIKFCPLHKAAPKLLEALKDIVNIERKDRHYDKYDMRGGYQNRKTGY